MNKVILAAMALGDAVVESEEYKNLQLSQEALVNDPAAARYSALLTQLRETRGTAEASPGQIDAEIDEIQNALQALPVSVAVAEARAAFSTLMGQVNSILEFRITGSVSQGCSGDCGTCSGCS